PADRDAPSLPPAEDRTPRAAWNGAVCDRPEPSGLAPGTGRKPGRQREPHRPSVGAWRSHPATSRRAQMEREKTLEGSLQDKKLSNAEIANLAAQSLSSFNRCLAITIRCISDVPSPISQILASR